MVRASVRRGRSSVSRGAAVVPLTLLVAGCTTLLAEPVECTQASDCRAPFSFGSVCNDEGLCEPPAFPERCARSFPAALVDDPTPFGDRLLIASLFSFTDHEDTLQAAELAVRQANEGGGLEGRELAVLHCDYTPEAGDDLNDIEAIEMLAPFLGETLEVPAIVGPRGSDRTIAAFNALRPYDTLLISPSATSPALTDLEPVPSTDETPGRLWRTAPPDSLQSAVIARDMTERGVRATAVLYQTGAYGEALSALFSSSFSLTGGTVAQFTFDPGADFSVTVARIAEGIEQGSFDEVLFISSEVRDYVTFFRAATATNSLENTFGTTLGSRSTEGGIFLPDTGFNTSLLNDTVAQSEILFAKVRGSRPAPSEGVVFNAFAAAFRTEFETDSTGSAFAPHSYDAAWMVLYSLAWAAFNEDSDDSASLARGLRRLSAGPDLDILPASWPTLVEAFKAGQSVNVRGASGMLDYDDAEEETVAPIERWKIMPDASEESGYTLMRIDVVDP